MTIERTLQDLQQMLHAGQIDQALAALEAEHLRLSEEPRALLPILDGLDRQRNVTVLKPLLEKLEALDILPLETSIFALRMTFRGGDNAEALKAVEKVLTIANDNIEALRVGGRIGNQIRDDSLALRYWERLGRAAPKDAEAALQAARILLRRKQYPEAMEWARKAIDLRPDTPEPLQIAVTAGVETGWPQACDELLVRLFAVDKPRALKVLTQLVQDLDCERAAKLMAPLQASVVDPALTKIINKTCSEWLVAALEQELASRELEAAAYYRAARLVQPNDTALVRALDRLSLPSLVAMRDAFNSRDFSAAIEHGLMATSINPDCFEAWQTVGRSQFARGDSAQACRSFSRCTELNSKDASGWLTYGLALNQAGDRCEALAAFQKARGLGDAVIKKEADASIAALHAPLMRDAQEAATTGDIDRAWTCSRAALSIRPTDPEAQQLQRNLLRQLRDQIRQAWNASSDAAEGLCRRYLDKVPNDTYAATVLGRTLMRMRSYAEALPVWEGLCSRTPGDSLNHLQVARCCRSLKIKDRGLAAAETALRLSPDLQEAATLISQFKGTAALATVD